MNTLMRIRGLGKIQRFVKKKWLQTQPRSVILLYHRVIDVDSDPQLLSVSPNNFAQHLEVIRQNYQPISLRNLVHQLDKDKIPHKSVAITFDDGFADNLHYAKPFLEQYQIPATVFVTAGAVDQSIEFWWNNLERILLQPGILPNQLSLTINGVEYEWHLEDSATYTEAEYQLYHSWDVLKPESPTLRHVLYRQLCPLIRPLSASTRQQLIREIVVWAGATEAGRTENLALTRVELQRLASGNLVEIGAHTMTHPVLSMISKTEQKLEIQQSKDTLEHLLEQPVASFAYPYGTRADYSSETVKIARSAGFSCTCSNFEGVVWKGVDQFQLPRFLVRNWSGQEFAHRLQEWFRG
jgi:peptidoglycan/xylan/chitin deacetylase (PgdA/CDA1 family)